MSEKYAELKNLFLVYRIILLEIDCRLRFKSLRKKRVIMF